jgi:glycosyltransferase involved in cell wall biosynthesis
MPVLKPLDRLAQPLVSIIVPSFRQGRFLKQALQSLIGQTYPHLEIIVRDNLSDDETPEVLEEFRESVTVEREHDRGQAEALHKGFRQARGSILGWLNADDLLMPDAVAAAVAALEGPTKPDIIYGHCSFVAEDGRFLGYFDLIRSFCADELRNNSDFIPQPSTFFRHEAYDRVGGIDPTLHYALDWDLWCRLAKAGFRFEHLSEVLSAARLHPATKTARGGWRRLVEISRVNLRHTTRTVPLAPFVHIAVRCFDGRWLRHLRSPMRQAWEAITGRKKTVVNGLQGRGSVVCREFAVRFPVYRNLDRVRLIVTMAAPSNVRRRVTARLNESQAYEQTTLTTGQQSLEWHFDAERIVTRIEIVGTLEGGSPEGIALSVELIAPPIRSADRKFLTP